MLAGLEDLRRSADAPAADAGAGDPPRPPVQAIPPTLTAAATAELVGRLYGELVATRRKLDALEAALDAANVAVYRMLHLLTAELGIDPPLEP